ncbi:hypothetical protein ACFZDI_11460 [Streptomyces sp. NPDC007907]
MAEELFATAPAPAPVPARVIDKQGQELRAALEALISDSAAQLPLA